MEDSRGRITRLAQRWSEGDDEALSELVDLVYDDLRIIAHRHMRRRDGDSTIQTTALVHEAFLRLAKGDSGSWKSRGHFFAFCSKAMRHVLIDYARGRQAAKRGGNQAPVSLDGEVAAFEDEIVHVLAVHEALDRLAEHDERMARIVECRYFGGLTVAETAEALDVSKRTIERAWTRARTYLHRLLAPGAGPHGSSPEGQAVISARSA